MTFYWFGGEDSCFRDSGGITATTLTSFLRTSPAQYARCGVCSDTVSAFRRGSAFRGGAVTSCWLGAQCGLNTGGAAGRFLGLVNSSAGSGYRGLWIGVDTTNPGKITINKYDGTTMTTLATSAAGYFPHSGSANVLHQIDVQLINFGASATVNVYVDKALAVTYSGDVTVTGVADVDAVGIGWNFSGGTVAISEIIVADVDTRSFALSSHVATGAGTTDDWSGAYTDVNETALNDATVVSTNTAAQDELFNITDKPAGTYTVLAAKRSVRAALAAGSVPTGISLGVRSGGTTAVGSPHTPGTSFGLIEEFFDTNPVTSSGWLLSEIDSLQSALRS